MRAHLRLRDLPNVLSLSRVLFAAGFVALDGTAARAGIIGVAGLTDVLDGWLARRLDVATRWGALLDPAADRIFVLAAALTLIASGGMTAAAAIVLLARDIATAIGFLVALALRRFRPTEFKARWLGKLVTVLQFATLLAAVAAPAITGPMLVLVAVSAAWSIVDYTVALWRSRA
jgi:CDP-diacylglycerol--glycerol-3-phosphate 3-phosphatidyltransferase/cardiolipin synthase